MIARVSEKPFWGPEEQIRRFINQHDEMSAMYIDAIYRFCKAHDMEISDEEIEKLATET